MGLARLYSRSLRGVESPRVIVEVHVTGGLPSFSIVGLPDTEVRESRDRVRSAIQMSGFNFPARRITVNLAPADLPKESGRYDLPIALGVLIASALIKPVIDIDQFEFAGELALDGALRKINGALAIVYNASHNVKNFVLPVDSAKEAVLVKNINIYEASTLNEVITHICGGTSLLLSTCDLTADTEDNSSGLDFSEVKGQIAAKFALEVAAAGRHSVLMIGNPGCGKSMLAERITTILPRLSNEQSIQTASIYSLIKGKSVLPLWGKVPFRAPHHSSSSVAIVGGGSNPKPGEISLAHNGVLFLDEIAEFDRRVLEVLREPLEAKKIHISRANSTVEFPADFQLVAAMNPCPCGNLGQEYASCKCSSEQIARYQSRVSAPLLDRIDLVVQMPYVKAEDISSMQAGDTSNVISKRVVAARMLQLDRQNKLNYELTNQEVEIYCVTQSEILELMKQLSQKYSLSARSYYKILKVARTIADLAGYKDISPSHVAQSAQYRYVF